MMLPAIRATLLLALATSLASCQKRAEPVPTPTQDQWRRVQEAMFDEAPTVAHPIDAVFGEMVRLIGWEVEPTSLEVGERFTLRLYWEVLQPTSRRWHIFVHLDGEGRQNLDHEAIHNGYPSVYWSPGEIFVDEVRGELDPRVGNGTIRLYAGLFAGDDRMPISRAGEGVVEADGRLFIGTVDSAWKPVEYRVRRASGTIRIDGQLDEPAWRRAPQTEKWVNPSDGSEAALETWARVLWDDEALYVGIYAEDSAISATMTERDQHLWEEEVVEIYLDPGNDGRNYLELQINPNNAVFDAVFARATQRDVESASRFTLEGLESAVHIDGTLNDDSDTDRSWTAEVRIPWTSLPDIEEHLPIANNAQIRANFYRYDRSRGATATHFAWSPVGPGSFHQPERFGTLIFTGAPRRVVRVNDETPPATPEGSGETP